MSKLTLICVLIALAYFAKAAEIEPEALAEGGAAGEKAEGSPEKSPETSEPEGSAPEDSFPKEREAFLRNAAPEDDFSDPFGIPTFALSPEDIMKMRSDPSTGTVVSGFSSSKSSSMKMVDGVLVEDKKNEQTIVNDGQTVTLTNATD